MKKNVILAAATLFLVSFTVLGQQPRGERGQKRIGEDKRIEITPEKRAEKMAKQLELTDVEKAKLTELFQKQAAKREAMKQEFEKMKEKAKAERKVEENEFEKIIGPEKFKKLQADRIEQLEKRNQLLMKRQWDRKPHQKNRNF